MALTFATIIYEQSVLGEITAQHLHNLSLEDSFDFSPGLVGGRQVTPHVENKFRDLLNCRDVRVALISRMNEYGTCAKGDIVLLKIGGDIVAGEVWLHVECDGVPITVISA